MWCTPSALASKQSTSSNIDTSKLKTKLSELTVENKTVSRFAQYLLFGSYASVSKLEK